MYSGMTIAMYILIMPMWRNNISCFVLQQTWLLEREYKLSRLAWVLLLAKEAENANSHNSTLIQIVYGPNNMS